MSIYLGQLGRLVELKCPASLQVAPDDGYSFDTTAEGKRVGQVGYSRGRRVWSLATSDATTPRDQGAIMAFVNGEWGDGPFVFVSADAPVVNMMSPEQASCDPSALWGSNAIKGGPMLTPDGWAGRSFANADPASSLYMGLDLTPVLPGTSVTGSAYVQGAGAVASVAFYDADAEFISQEYSTVAATAGTSKRSWITAVAPADAAGCQIVAINTSQACRPAVTWTDTLVEWGDGQGCPKAVLHGASRNLVLASRDPRGGRYSNVSYTVTEVG